MDATRPAARRLTAVLPCPRRASATAAQPFGVYLVSTDSIFSRDDGESRDVGYPSSVQLADGTLVTVYYLHGPDGIRHIAATRWQLV